MKYTHKKKGKEKIKYLLEMERGKKSKKKNILLKGKSKVGKSGF